MVARSLFALLPLLMVGGCLNGTEPNPLDHRRRTGAEPTPGEGEPDGAGAGDDGKADGDAPGQIGGGDGGGLGDEADLPVEGDLPCAIDKVMVDREKIKDMLVNWRKAALQDKSKRAQLRNSCPSQRRRKDLELRIAYHLITHPALFARALDLTAATHEARY